MLLLGKRDSSIVTVFIICVVSFVAIAEPRTVLVEAESFRDKGGWLVDQQFMDQMGSPFLLAHGMGQPVADAVTCVELPSVGDYYVHVRTWDWCFPWRTSESPGRFQVLLDDRPVPTVFGGRRDTVELDQGGSGTRCVDIREP